MASSIRRSRGAYVAEALLEYMVSLLVTGAFLSAILKQVGVSDAVTGIVSSLISVACVAQLFSGVLARPNRPIKRTILTLDLMNQLMFATLYLIPFFSIPQNVKAALFVAMILGAYLFLNIAMPVKYKWLMGFVQPGERGVFSARKEVVSLIGGMIFTLVMGALVDYFRGIGQDRTGFILCGATIFAVSALHFVTLMLVDDGPAAGGDGACGPAWQLRQTFSLITSNPAFRRLLLADILWKSAVYLSTPYYGTYLIGELGLTLTYVSVLSVLYSVTRALVSRRFGRFADKNSWAKLLTICLGIAAAGFFVNIFTRPSNGGVVYAVYYMLYAVSMAGINSGLMNITYDYIDDSLVANALGGRNAISGVCGFLASLAGGAIVGAVQAAGNSVLGLTVYAQEVLSAASFLLILILCLHMRFGVSKMPRVQQKS